MPRKTQPTASKQRLHQQSLFDYTTSKAPSSKAPLQVLRTSPSTSKRPWTSKTKRRKPARGIRSDSDPDSGTSSDVEAIHFEPRPVISISNSDDDDILLSPRRPTQKKAVAAATMSSRRVITSDNEKRGRDKSVASASSGEDGAGEAPVKRRKLVKGRRPSTPESEEDLDESHILQSRLRIRGKRTQYQRNLEKLKRRKKGDAVASDESSSDDGGEEYDDDNDDSRLFAGAKRDGSDEENSTGEAESQAVDGSFIVDDDATAVTNLPAVFSMSAHQDLTHHFKIICQLFVHMAVRPTEERRAFMKHALKEEDYFSLPLRMARNKLSGLRDSVASSVWRPRLRDSLKSFPEFHLRSLDYAVPHCDACHLGGRMSTLMGTLDGGLYDEYSFEPIEVSEDDMSDEDEDEGHFQKEYNLGRFCAARTQLFHRFSHWEAKVDALRGKNKFVRVAYYKGLLPPSDLSDADGIMDWLDQRGFVNMEWQKVKEMMSGVTKLESHAGKEEDFDLDIS
ncbi:hypothetical protein K488DRAFT_76856 [Vararia minispora EC-137]|uniref:Uncharacterized protein n=1 Tax=Vararia minispora EC-137 TaxID=1314806 RepID=A0ACB8QT60_9AGAM|nr:hypothetical protein K488DRAFT_76856 [Vararia minispora EC-137]